LEKIQEQTPFTPVIITCESEDSVHFDKMVEPIIFDILSLPLSPGRVKRTVRQACTSGSRKMNWPTCAAPRILSTILTVSLLKAKVSKPSSTV
jgi:DNA-binding NtrC family response regulator